LAALHFVMLVKTWQAEPLIYAAMVALLLLYRAVPVAQKSRTTTKNIEET